MGRYNGGTSPSESLNKIAKAAASGERMEQVVTEAKREGRLKLLKTLPGLLISAFFLWYTFRGLHREDFGNVHVEAHLWVA